MRRSAAIARPGRGSRSRRFVGDEFEVAQLDEAATRDAVARGDGPWSLCSIGRLRFFATASAATTRHSGLRCWEPRIRPTCTSRTGALSELGRGGSAEWAPEAATDALERLGEMGRACGTDWVLGVESRARALVANAADAENLHRQAIERLGRTRFLTELARAHLVYGEWLRREARRVDARVHLRTAHDMLAGMGMEAFAERARKELLATGEKTRKRTAETRDDLTTQERQIAELARDGLSNPAIGARLFLSPRTVEWHLRKVFGKLGSALAMSWLARSANLSPSSSALDPLPRVRAAGPGR